MQALNKIVKKIPEHDCTVGMNIHTTSSCRGGISIYYTCISDAVKEPVWEGYERAQLLCLATVSLINSLSFSFKIIRNSLLE